MKDLTKTMDITSKEGQEEGAETPPVDGVRPSSAEPSEQSPFVPPPTTAGSSQPPHPAVPPTTTAGSSQPPHSAVPPTTTAGSSQPPHPAVHLSPEQPTTATGSSIRTPSPAPSASVSGTSTPQGIPTRLAIDQKAHLTEEQMRMNEANMTEEEKALRAKEKKKGGLTKEQREELLAYEMERKKQREERVNTLAEKLINYISVWTETDRGTDVTRAFKEKTKLEIENLKMESFGLEIMHAIGQTYLSKSTSFLKSHKSFLGLSGFWARVKDKGALAKETWGTISTAIEAQMTMEEMARAEEKGGEEWTDEKRAEYEKRVTGKILAAAWRGSKYEIQGVLRDVCDRVLLDKSIKVEKRIERAEALVIVGELFAKVRYALLRLFACHTTNETTSPSATQTKRAISWPLSN
jgi:hypothetical protein